MKAGDYAERIKMQDARQTLPDIRLLMPNCCRLFHAFNKHAPLQLENWLN
jgi:hypothetical protein